jgi:adenosine deaminase
VLADLHRHLDGSLRPTTLRELAARAGVAVPEDVRFHPGIGLAGALSRFALTVAVLQELDAIRRVAGEICEHAAAIEIALAQRIGHGTTLLDDPAVVDLVLERGVTIEACPTSNLHTGAIERAEDHLLPRCLPLGVRACVCTDNTLFSDVTASQELVRARGLPA